MAEHSLIIEKYVVCNNLENFFKPQRGPGISNFMISEYNIGIFGIKLKEIWCTVHFRSQIRNIISLGYEKWHFKILAI